MTKSYEASLMYGILLFFRSGCVDESEAGSAVG